MSQLNFVVRIPQQTLKRTDKEDLYCYGLSALPEDVVLVACGTDGLRGLSLRSTQITPQDPSPIKEVYGVAFDAATDTLLLAVMEWKSNSSLFDKIANFFEMTFASKLLYLTSLRRGADGWSEVQRVPTEITCSFRTVLWVGLSVAFGSRVLLGGGENRDKLYTFDLSADHKLGPVKTLAVVKKFRQFTCTREGSENLVAFSHNDDSIALHRLTALQLETLASVQLTELPKLLFVGRLLIVAEWDKENETHKIQ